MLHIKRRFGKGATIAAASAALIVAGTGIAVASVVRAQHHQGHHHPAGHPRRHLHLRQRPAPAPSRGRRRGHPQPAGVQRRATRPSGSGHGWVTVTLVGGQVTQDHATLVLKQGQVDAAGIQASNPFRLAVTGGTGRFQNARGQATVQLLPGKGNKAKVTLSLLP